MYIYVQYGYIISLTDLDFNVKFEKDAGPPISHLSPNSSTVLRWLRQARDGFFGL